MTPETPQFSREDVAASQPAAAAAPRFSGEPAKFSREDVAASQPRPAAPAANELAFALGNARFTIGTNPKEGGYVIFAQDANNPARRATLRFGEVAELPALLSDPANEAFLLLVVGFQSPAATQTVRRFIDLVWDKIRVPGPGATGLVMEGAGALVPAQAGAGGAGTGIDPEKYYFVSLDPHTRRRTVNPQLGTLLKESAVAVGRLTGTAEKSSANRHELNILTGGQVLQENIALA